MKKSDDNTLIDALRILSRDIQSGDGIANACIFEAAQRLHELIKERDANRAFIKKVADCKWNATAMDDIINKAAQLAADWFTINPAHRTKKRLEAHIKGGLTC